MIKISFNVLQGYIVLLIVASITSVLGIYLVKQFEVQYPPATSEIIVKPEQKTSQYPDYESRVKLKFLKLAEDLESWTPEAKPLQKGDKKLVDTLIVEKGNISKAYIYIKASKDDKALTQWESIYLKMNNLGGHLFRLKSLAVPPSDKTELLFALNYIPYIASIPYSEQKMPIETSWFEFFKDQNEIDITSYISSLRPAKIEEMILYYECLDNNDCEIKKLEKTNK